MNWNVTQIVWQRKFSFLIVLITISECFQNIYSQQSLGTNLRNDYENVVTKNNKSNITIECKGGG